MCWCPEDLWSKDLEATIVEDTILQREETVQKWQVCQLNSYCIPGFIALKRDNIYFLEYILKKKKTFSMLIKQLHKNKELHLCRAKYSGLSHN